MQAHAAEFRPAEHLFEGLARDAANDQLFQCVGLVGGREQQARLVFGEDAPRRAQAVDQFCFARHHSIVWCARVQEPRLLERQAAVEGSRQQRPHLGRELIDGSVDGDAGRDLRDRQHRDR